MAASTSDINIATTDQNDPTEQAHTDTDTPSVANKQHELSADPKRSDLNKTDGTDADVEDIVVSKATKSTKKSRKASLAAELLKYEKKRLSRQQSFDEHDSDGSSSSDSTTEQAKSDVPLQSLSISVSHALWRISEGRVYMPSLDHVNHRMIQSVHYSVLLENRIKNLESQIQNILKPKDDDEEERHDEGRPNDTKKITGHKAKPWQPSGLSSGFLLGFTESHFRKPKSQRPITHVMTFLVGDQITDKVVSTATGTAEQNPATTSFDRVFIKSEVILEWFRKELPAESGLAKQNVFLPPYKVFCVLEPKIHQHVHELELELHQKRSVRDGGEASSPNEQASIQPVAAPSSQGELRDSTVDGATNAKPLGRTLEQVVEELDHFRTLVDSFTGPLKIEMEAHKNLRAGRCETVEFLHLWHLFYPGQRVCVEAENRQAFMVLHTRGGRTILDPKSREDADSSDNDKDDEDEEWKRTKRRNRNFSPFVLECVRLDYDGKDFDWVKRRLYIKHYQGAVKISSLSIQPLEYQSASAEDERLRKLVDRGRKFETLCQETHAHREYVGSALPDQTGGEDTLTREQIDSHVIIDFAHAYLKEGRKPKFGIPPPSPGTLREIPNIVTYCRCGRVECWRTADCTLYTVVLRAFNDGQLDRALTRMFTDAEGYRTQSVISLRSLTDKDRSLLPSSVWGYVLRNLSLYLLDVDKIAERDPDKAASFEDLVLPEETRKLVKAIVHAKRGDAEGALAKERPDLVRGKGRGVIVLLHGQPGTGKSSTAECVAEHLGSPIFSITCGNIGTTPETVERNLRGMFDLAHKWNCVMLLDEADVFLQARDEKDMHRNAIVSVFLRALEYYSGVLFLTTNKVGKFDEAFVSRIHLSLHYPTLDQGTTMKIWEVNMERTRRLKTNIQFNKDEILHFAKVHWNIEQRKKHIPWNGRQIRNAFQTAIALAEFATAEATSAADHKWEAPFAQLKIEHFRTVAKVSNEFSSYLTKTYGNDTNYKAFTQFDRYDDRQETALNQQHRASQRSYPQTSNGYHGQYDPGPGLRYHGDADQYADEFDEYEYDMALEHDGDQEVRSRGNTAYPSVENDAMDDADARWPQPRNAPTGQATPNRPRTTHGPRGPLSAQSDALRASPGPDWGRSGSPAPQPYQRGPPPRGGPGGRGGRGSNY